MTQDTPAQKGQRRTTRKNPQAGPSYHQARAAALSQPGLAARLGRPVSTLAGARCAAPGCSAQTLGRYCEAHIGLLASGTARRGAQAETPTRADTGHSAITAARLSLTANPLAASEWAR